MTLYKSFSVTETGISHTKHGKGCEDFSLHYPPEGSKTAPPIALAAVADGHGDENCFRSAKGAEFAAVVAKDAIIEFTGRLRPRLLEILRLKRWPSDNVFKKYIRDLVKHIIAEWHGKVERDYTANPVTDAELAHVGEKYRKRYAAGCDLHHAYGTTLIAVAVTREYWFGIHIGDGRFTALYPDGTFAQPVPWDERCYLNVTTSICDDDAFEGARIHCARALSHSEKLPAAVFLCSDGIDDNYPVEENEEYLYRLYRTIALTFVDDGFDSTCGQLENLANSFATKGKGDDTSIAGIIDMEAVKAVAPLLREQAAADDRKAEEEKAARADAVRLAAEKAAVKTSAEQLALAKPSAEKPAAVNAEKPGATEDVLNAIKNAHAREAYGKASSGGSDPANYGEFKTAENPKTENIIKGDKE